MRRDNLAPHGTVLFCGGKRQMLDKEIRNTCGDVNCRRGSHRTSLMPWCNGYIVRFGQRGHAPCAANTKDADRGTYEVDQSLAQQGLKDAWVLYAGAESKRNNAFTRHFANGFDIGMGARLVEPQRML